MFFGTTDSCLDSNCFSCEKNWTHMPVTSGFYGMLADEIWMDFEIFKILYTLNYLDFTLFNVIIVLKVHFSQLSSNKAHFKACLRCFIIR